jgi:threonine aldolase
MLTAIENATLFDDVFLEDPTTSSLEISMAELTSHEAGLLVLSGTMGNQVSLRCHLSQPPHSVLCDGRAHVLNSETGGVASLSGAQVVGIAPVTSDDIHCCPTRVISLENTLAGTITPVPEIRRISQFAKEHHIKLHLNGARLWEAAAAGAGSIRDYCRHFDSVSSVVVGLADFVRRARWIRKSIGGGVRMSGIIVAAAQVAVNDVFRRGPNGEGDKLRDTHVRAKLAASLGLK